jgi:A/G-specific adenine glycosylase
LADGERYPILDGNVKRVLCRYYAIEGSPTEKKVETELWQLAEQLLPHTRIAAYTQAIMDLGATVCGRRRPHCSDCPLQPDCQGYQQGRAMDFPLPKSRKVLPVKSVVFIMLQNEKGEIFLEKRPAQGIWGGLWSFPECATMTEVDEKCLQYVAMRMRQKYTWPVVRHSFTHFQLEITPMHILVQLDTKKVVARSDILWYDLKKPQECGVAAPVIRLLAQLNLPKFQLS